MRRKGFIAGALALCMVLGGTGYAYYTDALHITTTASTGELNVVFADLGYLAQYGSDQSRRNGWSIIDGVTHGENEGFFSDAEFIVTDRSGTVEANLPGEDEAKQYYEEANAYNDVKFSAQFVDSQKLKKAIPGSVYQAGYTNVSKKIEVNLENIYPGYAQAFRSDIVNDGSIAAKLEDIAIDTMNVNDNLKGMLGVAVYIQNEAYSSESGIRGGQNVMRLANYFTDSANKFTMGGVDFVRLSAVNMKDLAKAIEKETLTISADTTERFDIFFAIGVDPDYEGKYTSGHIDTDNNKAVSTVSDRLTENKENITLTIDLLWGQFNNHNNVVSSNIIEKAN